MEQTFDKGAYQRAKNPQHGQVVPTITDIHVGSRIARRRRALGRSIEVVSGDVAIDVVRLGRIEAGKVRPAGEELFAIAQALDVQISAFFAV